MNVEDTDQRFKEFQRTLSPKIAKEVDEINELFMKKLREIDNEQTDLREAVALSGTIAFASLSILAGNLIAKYTALFGLNKDDALLQLFYDELAHYYRLGLEKYGERENTKKH